ncbi:NADH-quinone oxidoreductase subunit C, partial [Streptomyces cinnamoneus]|uniref:NADH-quinone oxidoreductase subunit C n=1 Tax=Streptomyces cinnamoneus TaxID=53446 RepID=UPI00342A3105
MSEPTEPMEPLEPLEPAEAVVAWLPGTATELFGEGATAEDAYGLLTVDVPAERWITALETARDRLGCTFFDWLSAVDEPGTGFRVCAHVAALPGGEGGTATRRLLLRATVPHEAPALATAVGVYAGAAWHERETHEMFGIDFPGHPHLAPLLLPEGFEGHPLRKDFVLAARVVKAWPGAKEPGEAAEGGPKRRQMLPPGVPDPNEWGPLKGQLPPAPTRPARTPRAAAPGTDRPARRPRTTGEGAEAAPRRTRSVADGSASQAEGAAPAPRRTRSAAEGSASQAAEPAPRRTRSAADGSASQAEGAAPTPRRTRSAADGSASQAAEPAPRRTRSAADGSASQAEGAAPAPRRTRSAADGSASQAGTGNAGAGTGDQPAAPTRPAPRSSDAPWHHARPAFDEPQTKPTPDAPEQPEAPTPAEPAEPGDLSRRDGAQPPRRSPAVPDAPAEQAPDAAEKPAAPAARRGRVLPRPADATAGTALHGAGPGPADGGVR